MKRTYRHITSLEKLCEERRLIKLTYQMQEEQLKTHTGEYFKQFSPVNLFKKFFTKDHIDKFDSKTNISGKIMSFVLPLLLNKTLFRGSGLITKAVVGLASNKLGKKLDFDHLTGLVDKVKGIFGGNKSKKAREVDYGIPPYSETY